MILLCQSNTLDFCRNALQNYGEMGDQTLEYIGINLRENEIAELRVYRKKTPVLMELINKEKPYVYIFDKLMKPFVQRESVTLCDVSQSLAHGEKTFRAVFSLPKKQNKEEAAQDIGAFFSCFSGIEEYRERFEKNIAKYDSLSQNISPLMQIGVEIDSNCQLCGIKYYIRVQDFSFLEDCDTSSKGLTDQRYRKLCERNYKPIFVGINDCGGVLEEKVYFISKAVGFKTVDIIENEKKLAQDFAWKISDEIFDGLYEMNLYPEGIAFCTQERTWRLYFREFLNRGHRTPDGVSH